MENINIGDIGKSAKQLELADFSKTAQRAQTKGAKGDSKLQFSKDGRKVYFSHHRSGAKLQLTKLACTLTSIFGYDLKARVGVQPNDDRQKAAAAGFAQAVKSLDPRLANTLGAVKDYDGTSKNLKVAEFKEFDLENPAKVIAYNKTVAKQFALENPRLKDTLEEMNFSNQTFLKNKFTKESYPILLRAAAEEGNQLLTTKDLQTRLEHKLNAFDGLVGLGRNRFVVARVKVSLGLVERNIRDGLNKLNQAMQANNGEGDEVTMINALLELSQALNSIEETCEPLYPTFDGIVIRSGEHEKTMLDYLLAKNKTYPDSPINSLQQQLGMTGEADQVANHKLLVVLSSMNAVINGKLGGYSPELFFYNSEEAQAISVAAVPNLLKGLAETVAGQDVKPNKQFQKAYAGKLKIRTDGSDQDIQNEVLKFVRVCFRGIDHKRGKHTKNPAQLAAEPGS